MTRLGHARPPTENRPSQARFGRYSPIVAFPSPCDNGCRLSRHATTMKKIPLTGRHGLGKFTFVDDKNFEALSRWRWYYHFGYVARNEYIHNNRGYTLN